MEIPQELIEKALALTGKTMGDMYPWMTGAYENEYGDLDIEDKFSYPRFYAYLLDKEFIEEYYYKADMSSDWYARFDVPNVFWTAIYKHQSWDSSALISLLQKI